MNLSELKNYYIISLNQVRLNSNIPTESILQEIRDHIFDPEEQEMFADSYFYLYNDILCGNLLEFNSQINETLTKDQNLKE